MSVRWSHLPRVYLDDDMVEAAYRGDQSGLWPLTTILNRHRATMTSQFRAFEDYVNGGRAERR